ncbi:MAG TPA: chemotaxis protein CheX [Candidatus Angelobacter sp.]|jgi:chemotaxis protein CheX|nr:chemotaxis protein CheX [Candidatus Angelobacter sp.]
MKMELIQPFINAADAVLAETLQCPTHVGDVTMDEEAYRKKGVASLVTIKGDIEGRIIFDVDPPTAAKVASYLAGSPMPENEDVVRETVCELANMVIGSAVTVLNDQGFRFKIQPPVVHDASTGEKSTEDQESLVMCFDTVNGNVFMNIAMRYNRRRRADSKPG